MSSSDAGRREPAPRDAILIAPAALHAQLEAERDLPEAAPRTRVLDVRWTLPRPDGRADFTAGRIPGAAYVDLDAELAARPSPRDGRHPLPDPAAFQHAARSWGIRAQDRVVAYDGGGNLASARVWWLLRDAGFDRVRLLDGALPAWTDAGLPLETGPAATPRPGDVVLGSGGLPVLGIDGAPGAGDVAAFIADGGALLDARAAERYRGDAEPVDPRAGHIPGALSAPTGGNLDAAGCFLPGAALRERFAALGVVDGRAVGASCGSGVTAAHELVALALAGFDGALYPGSWSQWAHRAELPLATGDAPGS
ncbi:sulfurtransferase [Leucobacter allii]|uniref:Sulfurtransferase n=1 Tax=Leucobacter allii TaxID=2932247 RepID=A0ABY4FKA2_9MICO|nr:sulfurtransferase [Leucobacter allii]UOQ56687.1 sulfurtransferase [Leucobacter allii]